MVVVLAFMSLQCEKRFFFFFSSSDEKAILYNILLLFGGPLTTGGLRQWPKWPIGLACTAYHAPRDIGTDINFRCRLDSAETCVWRLCFFNFFFFFFSFHAFCRKEGTNNTVAVL